MTRTCPTCGHALLPDQPCLLCASPAQPLGGRKSLEHPLPQWSRNPWGRIAFGVLLSQGLSYGLGHLFQAGLLALGEVGAVPTLQSLVALQVLQMLALILGAMLAGAGQTNGLLYGAFVGIWNGLLNVLWQGLNGEPVTVVGFYGMPVMHTAVGGFAGLLGARIWKPLTLLDGSMPGVRVKRNKLKARNSKPRVKVHWARIAIGTGLAVVGVLWADSILLGMIRAAEGKLAIKTSIQEWLVTMEVSALAVFIGAAVAGATCWHGSVQGLLTGIATAGTLSGYWLFHQNRTDFGQIALLGGAVLVLSYVGGAFGGSIMPPLPTERKRSYRAAAV